MERMSRERNEVLRVALAFQLGAPFQERITHGIHEYAEDHGPWEIVSSPEGAALPLGSLSAWDGDGVIAMLETEEQIRAARSLSLPVVNLANSLRIEGIPTVSSNQIAIGRMAAEHLLGRNFQRFAFYGLKNVWYSTERYRGFRERVEEEGYECVLHEAESSLLNPEPWRLDREELGSWLRSLEPPVGLLAAHDYRARIVLEECVRQGIRIPEDVAVVGVDDDPVVCEYSRPSLTSIRQDGRVVGVRAAEMLHQWLAVPGTRIEDRFVDPDGVIARDSTKVTAVESPILRDCLNRIDRHHRSPIGVAWLVDQVGVSRRRLEGLFHAELGKTPHEVFSDVRVATAKRLLRERPDDTLNTIATECGFSEARRLTIVFRRVTGMSPRAYRDSLAPDETG